MAILEIAFVIGLSSLVGLYVLNTIQNGQRQRQLQNSFYQLLEKQNGEVSLIQLAAAARMDALVAQRFLQQQVQIFSAMPEVDAEGNTFYRFPKLQNPEMFSIDKRQDEW